MKCFNNCRTKTTITTTATTRKHISRLAFSSIKQYLNGNTRIDKLNEITEEGKLNSLPMAVITKGRARSTKVKTVTGPETKNKVILNAIEFIACEPLVSMALFFSCHSTGKTPENKQFLHPKYLCIKKRTL